MGLSSVDSSLKEGRKGEWKNEWQAGKTARILIICILMTSWTFSNLIFSLGLQASYCYLHICFSETLYNLLRTCNWVQSLLRTHSDLLYYIFLKGQKGRNKDPQIKVETLSLARGIFQYKGTEKISPESKFGGGR